jgi:hypothetical protein
MFFWCLKAQRATPEQKRFPFDRREYFKPIYDFLGKFWKESPSSVFLRALYAIFDEINCCVGR